MPVNDNGNEVLRKAAIDNGDGTYSLMVSSEGGGEVKVSSNDQTTGFLVAKIIGGTDIAIVETDDGASETLVINNTQTQTDESVKVSANDTTAGYLNGKIVAGTNITLTENTDGGNETLTIDAAGGAVSDELASVSANDTTPGYLNGKLVAGSEMILTENNDAGNETLTLNPSSEDRIFTASDVAETGLTAKKISSQTGNIVEVLDESDTLLSGFGSNGRLLAADSPSRSVMSIQNVNYTGQGIEFVGSGNAIYINNASGKYFVFTNQGLDISQGGTSGKLVFGRYGSKTSPTLAMYQDSDTGVYTTGALGEVGMTAGGIGQIEIDIYDVIFRRPVKSPIETVTSSTTLSIESTVLVDSTSGDITITLPTATSASGRTYQIKKIIVANNVIIDGNGTETIDGQLTQTISGQYDALTIQSDGTTWWIL